MRDNGRDIPRIWNKGSEKFNMRVDEAEVVLLLLALCICSEGCPETNGVDMSDLRVHGLFADSKK